MFAKLSIRDIISQDVKYHPRGLVSLYNKTATVQDKGEQDNTKKLSTGIALVELLAYIDEARMDENVVPVFKVADE